MTVSWVLTSRLSFIPDSASTTVAMSAVLGAVLALLPRSVGGGRGTFLIRAGSYTLGVVLALIVVSIIAALVPPAKIPSAPVTALGHRGHRAACGPGGRPQCGRTARAGCGVDGGPRTC